MKSLRICLLSYRGNPYCGGQGIYISYLARELIRRGHQVHVFVGPPYPISMNGADVHRIQNHNFFGCKSRKILKRLHFRDLASPLNLFEYATSRAGIFPEMFSFSFRSFSQLKGLLKVNRFDVIHDNQSLGYGYLLMRAFGIPIVATIHHPLTIDRKVSLEGQSGLKKRIKLLLYYPIIMQKIVSRRMDMIVTVSRSAATEITRAFGIPPERIKVVYNGLDAGVFRPLKGVPKKKGRLIFVGNANDPKKGLIYLLKAMLLLEEHVTLTIVDGGTPGRFSTERLVSSFGLKDRVFITPKLDTAQLVRRYAEAEVAVVPSLYEGFGFPAAEAMACGLPTITTTGGALPEVIGTSGRTGILVPPKDPPALAEAIRGVLANEKLRISMGEAARQRILNRFSWEHFGNQIEQIYLELVDAHH